MKKLIMLSSVLLGVIFLAGCSSQQSVSQTQPIIPAPIAQQPTTNQPVAAQPTPTPEMQQPAQPTTPTVQPTEFCAKEGEAIGASGMPSSCCSGLKPLGGLPNGYDGDCTKLQPPTGLSICANCGDGICNNNYEGKCNCPVDCADSVCGKEGDTLGGKIDRCCSGLKPKALSEFGGLFECAK